MWCVVSLYLLCLFGWFGFCCVLFVLLCFILSLCFCCLLFLCLFCLIWCCVFFSLLSVFPSFFLSFFSFFLSSFLSFFLSLFVCLFVCSFVRSFCLEDLVLDTLSIYTIRLLAADMVDKVRSWRGATSWGAYNFATCVFFLHLFFCDRQPSVDGCNLFWVLHGIPIYWQNA